MTPNKLPLTLRLIYMKLIQSVKVFSFFRLFRQLSEVYLWPHNRAKCWGNWRKLGKWRNSSKKSCRLFRMVCNIYIYIYIYTKGSRNKNVLVEAR